MPLTGRTIVVTRPRAQADSLAQAIAAAGHTVERAADGREACFLGEEQDFDAVVLDLGLPLLDGLSVLRRWRAAGRTMPVLILTARSSWQEKVAGMDAGADDYLAKPFDLDELEARLRAIARRRSAGDEVVCGQLRYDRETQTLFREGRPVELSPREGALLRALMVRPGHGVTKERLFALVFAAGEDVQPDAIEVIVHRLRRKIAHSGAEIMTLRGVGYLLCEAAAQPAP